MAADLRSGGQRFQIMIVDDVEPPIGRVEEEVGCVAGRGTAAEKVPQTLRQAIQALGEFAGHRDRAGLVLSQVSCHSTTTPTRLSSPLVSMSAWKPVSPRARIGPMRWPRTQSGSPTESHG